jgi:hypothetical protein
MANEKIPIHYYHSLKVTILVVVGGVLTGEIDRPSTERVEPIRGCLITQSVWNEPP